MNTKQVNQAYFIPNDLNFVVNVIIIFDVNNRPLNDPTPNLQFINFVRLNINKRKWELFNQILTDLKTFFNQLAALKNKHYF